MMLDGLVVLGLNLWDNHLKSQKQQPKNAGLPEQQEVVRSTRIPAGRAAHKVLPRGTVIVHSGGVLKATTRPPHDTTCTRCMLAPD